MKKFVFLVLLLTMAISSFSQQKKPLDHTVYDHWEDIGHQIISDDDAFVSYEINPQQFFDYYLKGAQEPEWMKKDIPAMDKNRDYGF